MRALLDSNVYISYLLVSNPKGTVAQVVEAGVAGAYELLISEELMSEFTLKIAMAPYLASRITPARMKSLVDLLLAAGRLIPRITGPIPHISRDYKDDYLLAYAVVGRADYLVTGDKDLLIIRQAGGLTIVSVHEFYEILRGVAEERPNQKA